jgi:hypothetical protein
MLDRVNRKARAKNWTMAALALLALALGGCATSVADLPLVGVPSDAPARPQEPPAYPAVHDLPAPREQNAMDLSEQAKIQKELVAARDRQSVVAGAPATAAGTTPPAKAGATPTAKRSKKPQQLLVSPSGRDKTDPIQPQG